VKHIVTELKLENGAKGLLIDIPDASVLTFEINFRAGEYLVDKQKWETPHLMEHMLLGANKKIPKARMFQAEFEKNGAYCNASTGTYDITYEAECADFEWDRILDLLLVAITQPLFLDEEFKAEFGNVKEELTSRSNNHFRHLNQALRNKYGFIVETDQERIKLMDNVQIKDIQDHYKRTHTTSNMRFVIAGSLKGRKESIKKALNTMKLPLGKGRIDLPVETPHRLDEPFSIPNKTIDNMYFYVDTFRLKSLDDDEQDALQLVNTMLTETLYSRMLGEARERGLVYSMGSGISQLKHSSSWWVGAQVLPKNAPELFSIITREFTRVREADITEEELQASKQYLLGRYQRGAQTVSGTANGYSARYFYEDIIDDYYAVPDHIKAVKKSAIVKTANSMFADDVWGMGILGTCSADLENELYKQVSVLW
jgi:predicted Zn-dependent peptidase